MRTLKSILPTFVLSQRVLCLREVMKESGLLDTKRIANDFAATRLDLLKTKYGNRKTKNTIEDDEKTTGKSARR